MNPFVTDRLPSEELGPILEYSRQEHEQSQNQNKPSSSRLQDKFTMPMSSRTASQSGSGCAKASDKPMKNIKQREKELEREIASIEQELQIYENDLKKIQTLREIRTKAKEKAMKELHGIKAFISGPGQVVAAAGVTDYTSDDFDWLPEMKRRMFEIFGIHNFRLCQQGVCNANMSARDIIVVMPTGGGKSLTYQLPALLTPGCTLVISPLISLIEDQYMHLREANINAIMLTSATSREEQRSAMENLNAMASRKLPAKDEIKLCYVTPERIGQSKTFKPLLAKLVQSSKLARIVIDEAHCVSSLGHDFRKDYADLGVLRTLFPTVPIMCLSATCPERVLQDLIKSLKLRPTVDGNAAPRDGTVYFSAPLYRPNLHYSVRFKPSGSKDVIKAMAEYIIENHNGDSGIVYCLTRKDTEVVAEGLKERGIKTGVYHADIHATQKQRLHASWRNGSVKVVCATIAFGLGIDKGDVRFVLHHSISKSIDGFYQETGRAGRDGKDADCVLFYRPQDYMRLSAIIYKDRDGPSKLYDMLEFAQNLTECRKILFARFLASGSQYSMSAWSTADKDVFDPCGSCDNCMRVPEEYETRDATYESWQLLKIADYLYNEGGRVTLGGLADAARQVGGGVAASTGRKRKDRSDEKIPIDLDAVSNGKVVLGKEDTEILLIHLVTLKYFREEYNHTSYSTNVYLAPAPTALRLTRLSPSGLSDPSIRVQCSFPRISKRRKAHTTVASSSTQTKLSFASKGKQKQVVSDSDGGGKSEDEDDFIVLDDCNVQGHTSSYIGEYELSDDDDDDESNWKLNYRDATPPRKRVRMASGSAKRIITEGSKEILDLCSSD